MMALCKEYGMEYFYYPVDNHADMMRSMVDLFPELCRRIDRGSFYIACAMGLHRTDIALSAYWVFCGADRGIEPPVLRGYLKESNHDTSKKLQILRCVLRRTYKQERARADADAGVQAQERDYQ